MSNTPNIAGQSHAAARAAPRNSASGTAAGVGGGNDAAAFGELINPARGGQAGEGLAALRDKGGQLRRLPWPGADAVQSQASSELAEDVGGMSGSQAPLAVECDCRSGADVPAALPQTPPPVGLPAEAPRLTPNQQPVTSARAIGSARPGATLLFSNPALPASASGLGETKPVQHRDTGAPASLPAASGNPPGVATAPPGPPGPPVLAAKSLANERDGRAAGIRPVAPRNPGPVRFLPNSAGGGTKQPLEARQNPGAGAPGAPGAPAVPAAPASAPSIPALPGRSAPAGSVPLPVSGLGETIALVEQETHFAPASQVAPLATLHQIADAIGSAQLSGPAMSPQSGGATGASNNSGSAASGSAAASSAGHAVMAPLNMAKPAVRLLQIQLQPADMGVVTVRMSLKDDTLALDLVVSNRDTATHIEQNRQTLLNLLRANGYVAEALMIQVADGARTQQLSAPMTEQGQASTFSSRSDMAGSDAAPDGQAADGGQRRDTQGTGRHGAGESSPNGADSSGESGALRDGLYV